MKNFIFKSQIPSTYKKLFLTLDTIQKNVLYLTHQVDYIRTQVNKLSHDKDLQNTVDKYFDETSHQTDSDDKMDLD